jgi:hypothetical protein
MHIGKLEYVLLAVFLILQGLVLLGLQIGGNVVNIVAGASALIAGLLFLVNR